jgi:hypothetical protein
MEIFEVRQEQGLTTSSSSSHTVSSRRVPFQERAFSLGDVIGVNAYRVNRDALKQRLVEGEYQVQTTPHFLVCQQPGAPTIVVHRFPPAAIDGDLQRSA